MPTDHIAAIAIIVVTSIYATIGAAFAGLFVVFGAARIDPSAAGMSASVRLLLLPGAAALWPVLLRKWIAAARRAPNDH